MKQILIILTLFGVFIRSEGQDIVGAEYFFDSDPGYYRATTIAITSPSPNLVKINFNVSVSSLATGFHRLYLRTRDINNKWSLTNSLIVYKPEVNSTVAVNVLAAEYFYDTDPGIGNGTNISITPATNLSSLTFSPSVSNLTSGFHRLYLRTRDNNGKWSLTNNTIFYKTTVDSSVALVNQVEYFIDKDPGIGKGVPVVVNPVTNMKDSIFPINITGLTDGKHRLYIRTRDSRGSWSITNISTFSVSGVPPAPAITVNKVSKKVFCSADTFRVSFHATGRYNAGNTFNAELSDVSGNFSSSVLLGSITDTVSGIITCILPAHFLSSTRYKIRVNSSSPAVTGLPQLDSVIINNRPVVSLITGASNTNAALSYLYSVTADPEATFTWSSPSATITPAANNASVVWNAAGMNQVLKVSAIGLQGCTGDTATALVNVYNLRIDSVKLSNAKPCPASNFTITAKASGVYGAANVFTAQLSNNAGSFTSPVVLGSVAGSTIGNQQTITINALLPFNTVNGSGYKIRVVSSSTTVVSGDSAAITISKPDLGADKSAAVCQGSFVNLTTLYTTTGLTTVWNTAQPDNVTAAGNYRLIVTNANGCKDTAFVTVTSPVVAGIDSVSATTNPVCSGTTTTLTANGVTGSNAVVTWWTATGGTSTNLGTGTTLTNRGAGTYFARVTADCGTPAEASITIATAVNVAITSVTVAANPICTGTTTTLTANGVTGTNAVVTWWTSTGGTGTNLGTGITLTNRGAGTYFARVTGTCGTPAEATITITNKISVAITSVTAVLNPICLGTTTTLTANGVVGTNAVVTWWTATGGTGTNLGTGATLTNRGAGTYFARVTGDCGTPVEATITITTAVNLAITSVTAAANPICTGTTITLTANGVLGTNAVVTWWTATGGTGTNLGTGNTLANRGAGTYFARVTGTCGTPVEATITITNNVNVAITSATAASSSLCTGTTTTLTANGVAGTNAIVIWWTGTGGTGSNLGTGPTLANRGVGTYYARVTGDCGTPVEASVTITLKASAGITSVSAAANPIPAGGTTTLTANAVTGTNAVVNWWTGSGGAGTNLGSGATLANVGAGTYYARVTADCGNAVEASITITTAMIQNGGQWVWMKGDSTNYQAGIYGTKGVAATGNKPGGRNLAVSWTDTAGNFWLFGGHGIGNTTNRKGFLNDLWKYTPVTNQWTWISGDSSVNNNTNYGSKGVLSSTNKPGGREGSTAWSDSSGNLWLFGGAGYATAVPKLAGGLNDLWKYNISTNQWMWVNGDNTTDQFGRFGIKGNPSSSNKPSARESTGRWTDRSGNLWLFGGGGYYASLNDLWKYNPTSNQWTWVSGDSVRIQTATYGIKGISASLNKPGGRSKICSWIDTTGNLWMFGGFGYGNTIGASGALNDLWKFSPLLNQWTWVSGDSSIYANGVYGTRGMAGETNKPGARACGVSWIDKSNNLWLFSGLSSSSYNDLWKFNITTNEWAWISGDSTIDNRTVYGILGIESSSNKPGSRFNAVSWKDPSDNMWFFGGYGADTLNGGLQFLNDLWKYVQTTPPPTITSFTPTTASTGTTVTITGTNFTGATTVSFGGTAATSFTVVNNTTITAMVGSGASGSVSVTTPNGTASLAGFIYCPAFKPIINPVSPIAICSGDSVTLSVTGGTYSAYAWSNAATTATITVKAAGKYTVTATTSTGCKGTADSVAVTINSLPAVPVITTTPSVVTNLCPGTVVSLTSSAATKYHWSNGATTKSVNVRSANSYIVKVFNIKGCSRKSVATAVSYQSCGTPATPVTLTKTDTTALLSWRRVSCVTGYEIQYREVGAAVFETVAVTDSFFVVTSLFPGTVYEWQVRAVCTVSPIMVGSYTTLGNFTTTGVKVAFRLVQGPLSKDWTAALYPNPVQRDAMLNIRGTLKAYTICISTIEGRELWKAGGISAQTVSLPVKGLSSGIYMVTVSKGKERKTLRLVIQR